MDEPGKAVFLSYTSQDVEAARRICEYLRHAGLEVWFDQSELRGGDAWDTAIRRQIKACALFIPLISANTRARTEGYFRLEWKLAVDRSHLMAPDRTFLLPVVIDTTGEGDSTVPERFREMQWIRLPDGEPTPAFAERVARLLALGATPESARPVPSAASASAGDAAAARARFSSSEAAATPSTRNRMRRLALSAAALTLLIAAAWIVQHQLSAAAKIVPYSAEDRRMTFASLPLQAAAEDPIGVQIAKATDDALFTSLDENHEWVQLASRDVVKHAVTQFAAPHDLAKAINVHFLFRGSVARAPTGYSVTLFLVDGQGEHVLGSESLLIPTDARTPPTEEIDNATGMLIFHGLEQEVARARDKPDATLDVRDLSYRAFVDWGHKRMSNDDQAAYAAATQLLGRALALAPDDPLALRLTVKINLCDCVDAWSTNVAEQQAIAEAALDRFLNMHPNDGGMLRQKAEIYQLRGRFRDSLLILDSVLSRDPDNSNAMEDKALSLLKLGRPNEALALATAAYAHSSYDRWGRAALLAAVDYELKDYRAAEELAQKAITEMSKTALTNSSMGTVRLTLIAAAAQLHDDTTAKAALADLRVSVPELKSVSAIRQWMYPQSNLFGYEPLFDGLRLAGLRD
jgi:hypothetical protein